MKTVSPGYINTLKMRRILTLLVCFAGFTVTGQAYPQLGNGQEIKLNIGLFLATSTVETSYEYFFTEDTSIGGTIYFDNNPNDFNGSFGIGPNFRAYFGYAPKSGFFAEAFALYYRGEEKRNENEFNSRDINYSTAALGIGAGNKWVTRSDRFTVEVTAGLGRNINPSDFQDQLIFRAGLSVGFRF